MHTPVSNVDNSIGIAAIKSSSTVRCSGIQSGAFNPKTKPTWLIASQFWPIADGTFSKTCLCDFFSKILVLECESTPKENRLFSPPFSNHFIPIVLGNRVSLHDPDTCISKCRADFLRGSLHFWKQEQESRYMLDGCPKDCFAKCHNLHCRECRMDGWPASARIGACSSHPASRNNT